jgi:N-methylhydantoinase A
MRLGVDIGGTFTDLVLIGDDGAVATLKVSSTPEEYGRAIVEGARRLLEGRSGVREVVHGTTVATNAILEGRGARTGLLTTEGFRDTLEIGRLRYPRLYDLTWQKPPPLVPRRWRREVPGRLDPKGCEVAPLDEAAAREAILFCRNEGVESLAICLLHAYANPAHERRLRELAREVAPELPVALSSDVLPEIGEYERTSTTVIDAYLQPVVGQYLAGLSEGLRSLGVDAPVLVMQSSGGVMPAEAAARHPIHVVESGPAAGVIAAQKLAERIEMPDGITLDMGGTTAKASVIERGELLRATEYEVGAGLNVGNRLNRGAGYILRVPAIDVAEVGAGGGSLVWVDRAGALHVGPRSAGAVPGPACYGVGEEPTLTDANLLLGYLNPSALLGGALPIDRRRAEAVFQARVAGPLGMGLLEAAHGVHRLGVASMVRVVKAVSSERGRDPRRFGLVAFGGNGPLHAAAVAEELGIQRVVVPPWPGLFSAFGLLVAEPTRHFSRTVLLPLDRLEQADLDAAFDDLAGRARADLGGAVLQRLADLRYAGQSFELRVSADGPLTVLRERFEAEHERTYGHRNPGDPVEVVHLRIAAVAPRGASEVPSPPGPLSRARERGSSSEAAAARREAYFGGALRETPVVGRQQVGVDPRAGPLIVEEYDATTLVPPGWTVRRDGLENLVLER